MQIRLLCFDKVRVEIKLKMLLWYYKNFYKQKITRDQIRTSPTELF